MKPTFITPFNKAPFVREERYYVLKISDMRKYLSREKFESVGAIAEKLNAGRAVDGKTVLQAVVVEHDWPEYEGVWQMIEARVKNAALNPNNDRRFWPIGSPTAEIVSPTVMKAHSEFHLPVTQPQEVKQESVAALRRVMSRLADLLDEDQFSEIEAIVSNAGVTPPQRQPEHAQHIGNLVTGKYGDSGIGIEFCIDRPEELLYVGQPVYTAPPQRYVAEPHKPLTHEEYKQIRHCMIAVRDWMAEGCDTTDIPRPHIATLVAHLATLQESK